MIGSITIIYLLFPSISTILDKKFDVWLVPKEISSEARINLSGKWVIVDGANERNNFGKDNNQDYEQGYSIY